MLVRWPTANLVICACLLTTVRAEADPPHDKIVHHPAGTEHPIPGAGEADVGVDYVFGQGSAPVMYQVPPSSNRVAPASVRGDGVVSDHSVLVSAGVHLGRGWALEARLPLVMGRLTPEGHSDRGRWENATGNLELGTFWESQLSKGLRSLIGLGVSLPTAQGNEPSEEMTEPHLYVDQGAYDQFGVLYAAAASRGYEENALFEPHRLGLIPRARLTWRHGATTVEPWVKVENLIATSSHLHHKYAGALIPGVRGAYRLHEHLEAGMRAWLAAAYAGSSEEHTTSLFLEPQVAVPFHRFRTLAGLLVPVAGGLAEHRYMALRASLGAEF